MQPPCSMHQISDHDFMGDLRSTHEMARRQALLNIERQKEMVSDANKLLGWLRS